MLHQKHHHNAKHCAHANLVECQLIEHQRQNRHNKQQRIQEIRLNKIPEHKLCGVPNGFQDAARALHLHIELGVVAYHQQQNHRANQYETRNAIRPKQRRLRDNRIEKRQDERRNAKQQSRRNYLQHNHYDVTQEEAEKVHTSTGEERGG